MKATEQQAQEFFNAYKECALWSSTEGDSPIEKTSTDFAEETELQMMQDCLTFLQLPKVVEAINLLVVAKNYSYPQAGHDFWLTRCGHGAGFWDRGLNKKGDLLTKYAQEQGERWLCVGDDGLIYQSK